MSGALAAEDSALHAGEIVLPGVVTAEEEVGDGGGLVGAIAVHARECAIDGLRDAHDGAFDEGGFLGAWVAGRKLVHDAIDQGGVVELEPLGGGGDDKLYHGAPVQGLAEVGADGPKLGVDGNVRATGKDQVVYAGYGAVEIKLDGDDRHTVEVTQALEGGAGTKGGREGLPEVVDGHGGEIEVGLDDGAIFEHEASYEAFRLRVAHRAHFGVEAHVDAALFEVAQEGAEKAKLGGTLEESHARGIRFLAEMAQDGEQELG